MAKIKNIAGHPWRDPVTGREVAPGEVIDVTAPDVVLSLLQSGWGRLVKPTKEAKQKSKKSNKDGGQS